MSLRAAIFEAINAERARQNKKHPEFQKELRMAVLAEEVGEVGTALQTGDLENLREELTQVAALAVRWLEYIDKEGDPDAAFEN
jgi:NTP pyrophosphatase (non-canonical NTP hydrolase)